MKHLLVAASLLILPTLALAQQQQDPATLQKVIGVLQAQRNQALDAHASAEVRAATIAEEMVLLKDRIQKLEAEKAAPPTK